MLIPVRCFTCGKVLGNKEQKFKELKTSTLTMPQIYDELGVQRICCKRIFLTYVDVAEKMAEYTILPDKVEKAAEHDTCRIHRAR